MLMKKDLCVQPLRVSIYIYIDYVFGFANDSPLPSYD